MRLLAADEPEGDDGDELGRQAAAFRKAEREAIARGEEPPPALDPLGRPVKKHMT